MTPLYPTRMTALLSVCLALAGCTPPGYGSLPFTDVAWPDADQPMSQQGHLQVEQLLERLGYLRGGVDGAITVETRAAIRAYQRDIGAPTTGHMSQALLDSLLVNAGQTVQAPAVSPVAAAPLAPAAQPVAPRPVAASPRGDGDGGGSGGGGGGGGGGSGGSPWN